MAVEIETVKICRLNLEIDGLHICSEADISLGGRRGYLITGPHENANTFLLEMIGGILPPGHHPRKTRVLFQGKDIYESGDRELKEMKKKIAFVFCEGVMISNLTVAENLLLPLRYHSPGYDGQAVMEKIRADFDFFGIPDVLQERPAEVSYYVRKKLAFIRASLREPELLLVDKPMFNLDEHDREQVVRYLENLKTKGITLIFVSRCVSLIEPLLDAAVVLETGKLPMIVDKTDPEFENLSRFPYLCSHGARNNPAIHDDTETHPETNENKQKFLPMLHGPGGSFFKKSPWSPKAYFYSRRKQ